MFTASALSLFVVVVVMIAAGEGLIIDLQPNKEMCVTEEGRKGTAFSGKFRALYTDTLEPVASKTYTNQEEEGNRYFIFRLTGPDSQEVQRTEDVIGTFRFVPTADGPISICFADIGSGIKRKRSVSFEHHHGTTTEEYMEIAKREDLYV